MAIDCSSAPCRIMLLSAGSLVAQNILDMLEGRRDRVRITSLGSDAIKPPMFRGDKAYLVPHLDDPTFEARLLELIESEKPDIILPGRDQDTEFLAQFITRYPDLEVAVPVGSLDSARILNDKLLSYRFAKDNHLAFANTLSIANASSAEIQQWTSETDFPMLAKPRAGYGSLGIRILNDNDELQSFLSANHQQEYLLQEMIGVTEEWTQRIEEFQSRKSCGVPLFFHLPEYHQYAGQVLIQPDGRFGRVFCSVSTMVLGRCEGFRQVAEPALEELTRQYALAIAESGWRGVFNFQCKKSNDGQFFGNEFGGRIAGGSSARRLLGFDEIRLMIQAFCEMDIGADPADESRSQDGYVVRALTDNFMSRDAIERLTVEGQWERA